jgi:hypothetical protein
VILRGHEVKKTAIILVAIAVLSGCVAMETTLDHRPMHVDLSGSDPAGVAIIRASTWSIGVKSVVCWIVYPAHTKRVTLDAGVADIFAVCTFEDIDIFDPSGGSTSRNSAFHFEALAGHEYEITPRPCEGCIQLIDDCNYCTQLVDVTANEVVAASHHNPLGRVADLSTGDNTAVIDPAAWPDGSFGCWLTDKYVDYLIVDSGTVTVESTCAIQYLPLSRPSRVRSSFHFDAETGHSYTVRLYRKLSKDKCMQLVDITSEDITIACEPFEKVE